MRPGWKVHYGPSTRARRPLLHRSRVIVHGAAVRASQWLRLAWLIAFPARHPDGTPGPVPPLSTAAALRDGALLYEIDGEPVSKVRVATK